MLLAAAAVGFFVAYPLCRLLVRLLYVDGRVTIAPVQALLDEADLGTLLLHTAILIGASATIALVIGSLLAWLSQRTDAGLGTFSDAMPILPFLIPPMAAAMGWTFLLSSSSGYINRAIRAVVNALGGNMTSGPFDVHTWYAMIFLYTIYQIPFAFLMVSAGLRNLDAQVEESSRVAGASLQRTLRRVSIPMIKPYLGASMLYMVWFGFAFYSGPAVFSQDTDIRVLSVEIVRRLTYSYPADVTGAVGLSIIVFAVVGIAWVLQRRILGSDTNFMITGRAKSAVIELGAWKWPARLILLSYPAVIVVFPLVALLLLAFTGFWGAPISFSDLSLGSFGEMFSETAARRALFTSLRLAVFGATLGILLAVAVALLVKFRQSHATRWIDGAVKLPAVLPGTVIGVAFILAFAGPPFALGGSFMILLLAYLVIYMPQASVAADAAASQIGSEMLDASAIAGAGPLRSFFRIIVPVILPSLVAGWALIFVWMLGESDASILLSGYGNPVIVLKLMQDFRGGDLATVSAIATVAFALNVLVIGAVMALVRWRRRGWQ